MFLPLQGKGSMQLTLTPNTIDDALELFKAKGHNDRIILTEKLMEDICKRIKKLEDS